MPEKVEPRPLPEPIDDEGLERWTVQFQYRAGIVLDHILLDQFGAILARVERAEKDRDQARRAVCHLAPRHPEAGAIARWAGSCPPPPSGSPDEVREVCRCLYGSAEADRLFPPEAAK